MIKIAKVEKRFKSPGPQPNGLQAAPDGLWIIDQVDLKIYKVDWETGDVLFEAQTDTEHSSGITVGGGYVWIASTFELQIAKLDMETGKTIAKYDSPGVGVASWREGMPGASETGAHGLEWRNGKIYIASPPSQFVHVVDAETWTEEHAFRTPGLRQPRIGLARRQTMGGGHIRRHGKLTGHGRWPRVRRHPRRSTR